MMGHVHLKCSINREYLPLKSNSIIFLALEVLPPPHSLNAGTIPSAICLVIDRSGSMKGKKIQYARTAASGLIDQLRPTDYLGMITFSDKVEIVSAFEQVNSIDRIALISKIEKINANGNTEMFSALETSLQQLEQIGKNMGNLVKRVILLSDGKPTDRMPQDAYARLSIRMREMGIMISALGVGKGYNEDLMAAVAENSGGSWKHIASPADIPDIFTHLLEDTRTVVRLSPEIQLHFEKDLEVEDAYKAIPVVQQIANYKRSKDEFTFPISDIRAGELQTYAFKLSVPPGLEGSQKLVTVAIKGDPQSTITINVVYSGDRDLISLENDAFPRGIFATAKTQVRTRTGLSGDIAALQQAEQMRDTIIRDPSLADIAIIREATDTIGETIVKARSGLTEEETKKAKEGMTRIRRKQG